MEISLPDENGRLQILQIHTNKMKENSFLAPDVNLQELGMLVMLFMSLIIFVSKLRLCIEKFSLCCLLLLVFVLYLYVYYIVFSQYLV